MLIIIYGAYRLLKQIIRQSLLLLPTDFSGQLYLYVLTMQINATIRIA